MCVSSVIVRASGEMQFNVAWTIDVFGSNDKLYMDPDVGNRNMYATDNLGNRYDHIALDGSARDGGHGGQGEVLSGYYLFPPAAPGAFVFVFYDDDQHVSIPNINLASPSP